MKRSVFLIVAGVLAILFGTNMLFMPGQMLDMVAVETNLSTRVVLQWMGCPLVSIGVMNLLSRSDEGSPALRAIMVGNILLHVMGEGIDVYDYLNAYIKLGGVIMGTVVHGTLTLGFLYFLTKLPKAAKA